MNMNISLRSNLFTIRFALAVVLLAGLIILPSVICAQQTITENHFKIDLPDLWSRSQKLPPGFEIGFQKPMPQGYATFYFHHEILPPHTNNDLYNTADMRKQFDALIRHQFPDAEPIESAVPGISGKLIINIAYKLTDTGKRIKRRYTYFITDRTAFVVMGSAAPEDWEAAIPELDKLIGSLVPGKAAVADTISDDTAVADLKQHTPTLLLSWPNHWYAELGRIAITTPPDSSIRNLEIELVFLRRDIGPIYENTKLIFEQIKHGIPEEEIDTRYKDAIPDSLKFIHYIGQVWGAAWSTVWKCESPLDQFQIHIADLDRRRIGAVTISREDGQAIISGKVAVTETRRVAAMYHFE
jgi:hypothetical protein